MEAAEAAWRIANQTKQRREHELTELLFIRITHLPWLPWSRKSPPSPAVVWTRKSKYQTSKTRELFSETTDINSSSWPKYLIKRGDTDPDLALANKPVTFHCAQCYHHAAQRCRDHISSATDNRHSAGIQERDLDPKYHTLAKAP